jgi:hypothetical protein
MAEVASELVRLRDALKRRRTEGLRVRFWLRDDDLVQITPRIDAMLAVLERFSVRTLLAIIPAVMADGLPAKLPDHSRYVICQHGLRHTNHEPLSAPKAEFGPSRSTGEALADIKEGHRLMSTAFGEAFAPIFVPPWNRLTPDLRASLPKLGFRGFSAYGSDQDGSSTVGLTVVNADIDVLRWGTEQDAGATAPRADLFQRVTELLSYRRRADEPQRIGLLTHHLAMDSAAWDAVAILMSEISESGGAEWADPAELFAIPTGHSRSVLATSGPS